MCFFLVQNENHVVDHTALFTVVARKLIHKHSVYIEILHLFCLSTGLKANKNFSLLICPFPFCHVEKQVRNIVSQVLKTILRLGDLFEGLIDLGNVVIFMVIVLQRKKVHREQISGKTRQKLPCILFWVAWIALNYSSNDVWLHVRRIVDQGNSPEFWCPGFLMVGDVRHGIPCG